MACSRIIPRRREGGDDKASCCRRFDLAPTGKIASDRVLVPSGAPSLDAAALRSAEASTHTLQVFGRAPVAGTHLYAAAFLQDLPPQR